MEITKELFDSLLTGEISHKAYKEAIGAIENKVDEIWNFIIKASGRRIEWWSFKEDFYDDYSNDSGGEFEPTECRDFISIYGEFSDAKNLPGYAFDEGFPTNFLWSDYQTIVNEHVQKCKDEHQKRDQEAKAKKVEKEKRRIELKAKYPALVQSIRGKLTEEELSIINFKKV